MLLLLLPSLSKKWAGKYIPNASSQKTCTNYILFWDVQDQKQKRGRMWCCGHIEDAMPSFNVLLQTKAHPKIIMLFGLATKKSALKV